MMGKFLMMLSLSWALAAYAADPEAGQSVESLRGATATDENSVAPQVREWLQPGKALSRSFPQQPPLIPHGTEGYEITRAQNACLNCHGSGVYEQIGATGLSKSHYIDREGNESVKLTPARHFCNQCHVGQRAAEPLVENEFRPASAMP